MAKMNKKKFNIKGVFDGIRFSVGAQQKSENEIEETLRTDHFQVCNVSSTSFLHPILPPFESNYFTVTFRSHFSHQFKFVFFLFTDCKTWISLSTNSSSIWSCAASSCYRHKNRLAQIVSLNTVYVLHYFSSMLFGISAIRNDLDYLHLR